MPDSRQIEMEKMVQNQLVQRGIDDPAVLDAVRAVPRHQFVPAKHRNLAYHDNPLPLPTNQTISQPYVVAFMIQSLQLQPHYKVLEIGTGSGYASAILGQLVQTVYSVEREATLVHYAQTCFQQLAYDNIHVFHGDGTLGWQAHAPYPAILVSASSPRIPPTLRSQLTIGGRMVIPVGGSVESQRLLLVTRKSETEYSQTRLTSVRFVPLIGKEGWTVFGE